MAFDDTHNPLGKRLGNLRRSLGLSVADVSERTGIRPTTIQSHEKGARGLRYEVIHKYATTYGVEPHTLFERNTSFAQDRPKLTDAARDLLLFDWWCLSVETAEQRTQLQRLLNSLRAALKDAE